MVEEMKAKMANRTDEGNSRSGTAPLQGARGTQSGGVLDGSESNAALSDMDDRFHVVITNNFD